MPRIREQSHAKLGVIRQNPREHSCQILQRGVTLAAIAEIRLFRNKIRAAFQDSAIKLEQRLVLPRERGKLSSSEPKFRESEVALESHIERTPKHP